MASETIRVGGNLGALHNWFGDIDKQVRFAASRAINDTTQGAQKDYRRALPSVFHHVAPFTLNSSMRRPATKETLTGAVELRQYAGKGTPAAVYLAPQIEGGGRPLKPSERRLLSAGINDEGYYVPAGNRQLTRGQIVKILSQLGALEMGNANPRKGAKGVRLRVRQGDRVLAGDYFVARSKRDGAPLGVWQLVSPGHVKPVLIFPRRAPAYRKRLDFYGLIGKSADRNFGAHFERRLAEAIASAR